MTEIARDPGAGKHLLHYPPEYGFAQHRVVVAQWLVRLATTGASARVMLTNGAQQSIACVVRTLLRPGDVLLTEDLSYHGILPLEQELRLQVVGVACDAEGLRPDALERAVRTYRAKVLYCIPSLHMPTSSTMTLQRRQDIAKVAKQHGLLVIEDCVHAMQQAHPLPALSTLLPDQSFLVGGFSKLATPMLRLGFVEADPKWLGRIALALRADSLTSSTLMAEILRRWILNGELDRLTHYQREATARRYGEALDTFLRLGSPEALPLPMGHPEFPFLWLPLPDGLDTKELTEELLRHKVLVRPTGHFAMGRIRQRQGIRISLCSVADSLEMLQGLGVALGIVRKRLG